MIRTWFIAPQTRQRADFSAIDDAKRRGAVAEALRDTKLLAVTAD
ncbi:hypothetical protein QVN60_10290 [Yersinia aleksiciae]|nr:hypothetical protein [Yersinia aleksiciae]MDN0123572.1 hypothetical protein [Yersinia aleksiciae]